MPKTKAVILHFLFSLTIVSCVLAVIFLVWYPPPMFRINGAESVLKTLIGVDLVLGPALTAYLYRPGKKGLWIDMWFIAVVQLSALIYGVSVIYQERPQFMIFSQDRFVILAGKDVRDNDEPRAVCQPVEVLPCVAVAVVDEAPEARAKLLEQTLEMGVELEQLPQYWQPLREHRDRVLEDAHPLQDLIDYDSNLRNEVEALERRHGRALSAMVFVPVINKNLQGFSLIVDAETVETLDVVVVDPWEMR